jgi:protein O-GlcNAc transferase
LARFDSQFTRSAIDRTVRVEGQVLQSGGVCYNDVFKDQLSAIPNLMESFQAAVRAYAARDWTQAEALCRQVLHTNSRHVDALHMLALVFRETGRLEDAIAALREAIAQQPGNAVQWTNLGEIHRKHGHFADAVECQRQAIALEEKFPEAHLNLSLAYRGLGEVDNAITAAVRATELRPDYAKAHFVLGNLRREEGDLTGAVAAYQTALEIHPDSADVHLNIAAAWLALLEPAKAVEHYESVLRLDPSHSDAEYAMAQALASLGRIEEAKAAYARAAAAPAGKPCYRDPMSVLVRETLTELIAPSRSSIAEYKARVNVALNAFAADPGELDLSNLHMRAAAAPNMMLVYYGGNVRPIMEQYAQTIGAQIPRWPLRPRQGKSKLGIVVTHGHEGVFARCWGGIAERLSRELFDIRLVCSRAGANILQTMLKVPQQEYLLLPRAIDNAARLLHEHEFDWLHYWEIGTNPMNYYLPFFRTAPGQSGCWGWPVTSGNPNVNSFLSCDQFEPPEGPSHYTEQLVLLKHLPTYYVPTPVRNEFTLRSWFGLEDTAHVYLCTQSLLKYHPDFDPLLADLLRRDQHGLLVIIAHREASVTELLLNRFSRTMPDVASRVRVMPRMEREEYLGLVAASDVVLDTLYYGGGANTVYDAAAVGTPIVTLPGEFHRSRWAAAVNRRLGLTQLIAGTPREYVATAVEVASNADLRQALRRQILQAGEELFENAAVIREHDAYFSEAINASRALG